MARYRECFGGLPESGLAGNFLSTLPQNSVLLTFLTSGFRSRRFSGDR
jgi:hypothetical protein